MQVLEATKLVRKILREQGFDIIYTNKLKNSRTVKTYLNGFGNPRITISRALTENNVDFAIRTTRNNPRYNSLIIEILNNQI